MIVSSILCAWQWNRCIFAAATFFFLFFFFFFFSFFPPKSDYMQGLWGFYVPSFTIYLLIKPIELDQAFHNLNDPLINICHGPRFCLSRIIEPTGQDLI